MCILDLEKTKIDYHSHHTLYSRHLTLKCILYHICDAVVKF